jgi:hypothetical protein
MNDRAGFGFRAGRFYERFAQYSRANTDYAKPSLDRGAVKVRLNHLCTTSAHPI